MKKLILLVSALMVLSSCSTRPAEPTGFLADAYRLEDGKFLQKVWHGNDVDLQAYNKISVAPITTDFLRYMGWWERLSPSTFKGENGVHKDFQKDANMDAAKQLAKFFESEMIEAFIGNESNTNLQYIPFTEADDKTLMLKISIAELVPIKKVMLGLGLIGDGSLKGGSIAIEGQLRNARTHELLAMFSDRQVNNRMIRSNETPKLSWYSHAKPVMRSWAEVFVKIITEKK